MDWVICNLWIREDLSFTRSLCSLPRTTRILFPGRGLPR
jgi:hypothetical protein